VGEANGFNADQLRLNLRTRTIKLMLKELCVTPGFRLAVSKFHELLPTTRQLRRWLSWVRREFRKGLRELDVRKPVHAIVIGLLVGGTVGPVLGAWMTDARYHLGADQLSVMTYSDPVLSKMLSYDTSSDAVYFNKDGQPPNGDAPETRLGATGGKPMYTAEMPTKAGQGISITDTEHQVKATMTPQYGLMDGKNVNGRVLYPLTSSSGVLGLTPKANGVKEDIVLDSAPSDTATYSYKLSLDAGLKAQVQSNGAIGVFSGNPSLFGNISYGSAADKQRVMTARQNAPKTFLMFEIPAPEVTQADGLNHGVKAHFELNGDNLSVVVTGLSAASYPLSIDPSFIITSQSDFLLGKIEDNLTLTITSGTDAQLNRALITGGNLDSWTTTSSTTLPGGCSSGGTDYNFGLTSYNGYLYLVGGGNGGSNYLCYAAINSNGTLANWAAATSTFPTGRTGAGIIGFNGYIYVIGGETANGGTQYDGVEYAPVTSTGDITGTWDSSITNNATYPYGMGTGRTYFGVAEYNDYIYACGGATAKNNGGLDATCEYTAINTDGSLGKPSTSCTVVTGSTVWCTASGFGSVGSGARDRFNLVQYNGYLYILGGYSGATTADSDVLYVPILSNNSIGTWTTTTSMSTILSSGWRSGGAVAEDGYIYEIAGCYTKVPCSGLLSGTYFTEINSDGTLTKWDSTSSIATARFYNGAASYNGVLYTVGGCTSEPNNNNNCLAALGDTQYATINGSVNSSVTYPGSLLNFATAGSAGTARSGVATLAFNGYLYTVGGCDGTSCGTMSGEVDSAPLNDDGTVGTWATQTAIPTAKYGGALAGYNGKIYYIGGDTGTGTGTTTVYSASPSSTGGISSWTTETNTLGTGRYWEAAATYGNYIYVWGGTGTGGPFGTVDYTSFTAGGAFAAPTNCVANGGSLVGGISDWCRSGNTMGTARYGFGGVAYAGNLYAVVGINSTGAAVNTTEESTIGANGYPGTWTTSSVNLTDTTVGHKYVSAAVAKGIIYIMGGINTAGTPAAAATVAYGALNSSENLAQWSTSTRNLATARWGAGGASAGGRVYVVGGCTSASSPCTAYVTTAGAEYSQILNGGTGLTSQTNASAWSTGTTLPTATADFMSVAFNDNIYVIGGCTAYSGGACTTWSTQVIHAPIGADGSIGTWTATSGAGADTQFPTATSLAGAIAYADHIYIVGGTTSSGLTTSVYFGTVSATGGITSWTATNSLPAGRSNFGIATAGGFLYVTGGLTSGPTKNKDVVYTEMGETGPFVPPVCSDGTLTGDWCESSQNFTDARQDLSALAYNSALYVVGGYDGTNNLNDIQYATLNTDGSLNSFAYTNYRGYTARARQVVAANGFMYFLGDENSGTDSQFMPVNANHTLGEISQASSAGLANAHAHGAADFENGFFYILGGCTLSGASCTTPSTHTEYTGQKATARLGAYAKMFNTQVNTSPELAQVNGTGQYIIEFRTAAVGSTVLGVPQVISPAYASKFYFLEALDASGANVGIALNYYVFLIIDDSGTGPFPDAASTATDINIYYHANPGRRLRHGASFTNTACAAVPQNGCLLDTAP
jgi:hypothetical protein